MKAAWPFYALGGLLGVGFVVWLFTSMARTPAANRILITLVVCFTLVAVAGALGMLGGDRGRERER